MGKYIHKFDTISDLYDYLDENPIPNSEPWVSQTAGNIMTYSQKFDIDALTNQAPSSAYVDLGFPSGTLWATMNVGAYSPEESGDYFAWGETYSKESYTSENYAYGTGDPFDYYDSPGSTLELLDDAANNYYGGLWHIPTLEECWELFRGTSTEFVTINGVSCARLTSVVDSTKSIILPCTGIKSGSTLSDSNLAIIWANRVSTGNNYKANILGFDNNSTYIDDSMAVDRYKGCCVRAVVSNARRPWHNIPEENSGGAVIK